MSTTPHRNTKQKTPEALERKSLGQRSTPTAKQQTLTLVAMCLALGMAALDDTVVNVALPSLQSHLDITVSGLQWILNAYLLPIACLVLPAGNLGDIYGRRRVFLTGLIGFVAASILVGCSVNGEMAIAGRLLQGIGAAALLPSSLAILSEAYPNPTQRTKAIGLWSGVSGLALIIGPALGGVLVDTLGWRSIFFLNVPLGLCTFWLTAQVVPVKRPNRRKKTSQLDLPGMVLSVVAIAAFITLLMLGEGLTLRSLSLAILSLISAIAFIIIEAASARPMLPPSLFRQLSFAIAFITNAFLFFMLVSLLFLFSLFLQQVQGYSAIATGLRFLPLNGAFIFASIVSGYFSARLGWRSTITLGFLIAGIAVLSLTQVQADTPFRMLLVRLTLVGFGVGFTLSPLTAAAMSGAPEHHAGIAAALMNTSTRLGGALGIAIQGNLFTSTMGTHLQQRLASFDLSASAQQSIITEALSHGATRPALLSQQLVESDLLSFEQIKSLVHQGFISGLQQVLWVGAIALLISAGLSFCHIRAAPSTPIVNR
ncbi:MAG: MFS transporter [Cyanobacteria bacterium J06614_10]